MKEYRKNLKVVIAIFSLLLCFSVAAQGPPGGGQGGRNGGGQGRGQQRGTKPDASEILSKLDTNKDEVIDKEEASKDERGKISEHFEEIDSNEDSFIDLEELKNSLENRSSRRKPKKVSPEKIIKKVDDNKDGTLNELEVAAKQEEVLIKHFSEIDLNEDNELDLDELKKFFSKNDKKQRRKRE